MEGLDHESEVGLDLGCAAEFVCGLELDHESEAGLDLGCGFELDH